MHVMRQGLPAGPRITQGLIKQHHPIQTVMAVEGGQASSHPTALCIRPTTHHHGPALIAGENPMASMAMSSHHTTAELLGQLQGETDEQQR